MADTPPRRGKAFDIQNPGMREYAIVGIAALALGVWYFKRKQSQAAAAASQQQAAPAGGTPVAGAGGGGLPWGALFAWLQNNQSSPAPADNDTTGSSGGGGKQSATVRVPSVVGQSYAAGQANLAKVNLYSYPHNTPAGKGPVYISAQNPAAGRVVKRDSGVDLVLVRR